ncbi:MAG: acyltransferase [Verrucomicrobia bacterium]|nr:acyltransferase [Verrucomicrobiota bacterium]
MTPAAPPATGWLPRAWLPKSSPMPAAFSAQLDLIRWLAALLVCITHVRSIMIADYTPASGLAGRIFYFVHGFGHSSVITFFILSGYLVGGEVLQSLQQGNFNGRAYFAKRFTRLYAVYAPGLMLGFLWDWLGARFFNSQGVYTHGMDAVMVPFDISTRLTTEIFTGNLVFLQTLVVPALGSNSPLWSLANEAWYYLLFPLIAAACFAPISRGSRLGCIAFFLACAWFVQGQILLYFGVWLLGLVPHFLPRPILKKGWPSLIALGFLMGMVRCHQLDFLPMPVPDYLLGVLVMIYLNTLSHQKSDTPRFAPVHHRLARFSYSLYICHWPFALFLAAVSQHYLGRGMQMPFGLYSISYYLAVLGITYAFAWFVSCHTEQHTPTMRRRLSAWLGVKTREEIPQRILP